MPFQLSPYDSRGFCRYVAGDVDCAFLAENELAVALQNRRQYVHEAVLARSETMCAEEGVPTIVTINSPFTTAVRRLALLFLGAVFLLSAACGEKPSAKIEAHRLGRPQILEWLATGFRAGMPIEFKSREGRGCCDMGDTSLVFHPDQTIHILRERFVGTEFNVQYNILADGKIAVVPIDNKEQADYLLSEDIHDFYLFHYGSSLYLVQESNVRPDLAVPGGTHWPLKYMPGTNAAH